MNFVFAGPALVTLATLLLLFMCAGYVGRMRVKHGVMPPASSGHVDFEIAMRIQMNTLENTVLMLPALWLAALFFSPLWATLAGGVWLVGRIWFAIGYATEPKKRGGGFLAGMIAWAALMLMATWGVVRAALA
jgi:glutathione S-transferase